ncbi:MAG: hypothetical protein ACREO9_12425 [Lysobacterales bacterium]
MRIPASGLPASGARGANSNVAIPQISSKSLEMLMMAIDNPTEAAARQMTASRKLIVFISKIVAGVA